MSSKGQICTYEKYTHRLKVVCEPKYPETSLVRFVSTIYIRGITILSEIVNALGIEVLAKWKNI